MAMARKNNITSLTKRTVVEEIKGLVNNYERREPYITNVIFRIKSVIERWEYE
jgi:hypothetical protein